jgi:hypothetical protein
MGSLASRLCAYCHSELWQVDINTTPRMHYALAIEDEKINVITSQPASHLTSPIDRFMAGMPGRFGCTARTCL